jgi:uncharacterized protein
VYIGIVRIVLRVPEARSLKDRRHVVRSFKERVASRLRVTIAEVGNVELHQVATLGAVTVTRDSGECHRILNEIRRMAATLPAAAMLDIRGEVLSMGESGKELKGGIEGLLSNDEGWYLTESDERN